MNSNDNLWINKWKPHNLAEIVGNKQSITKMEEWLVKFNQHNNNAIILSGGHGIGKSLTIELLFKKYNYIIKTIHPDDLKSFRNDSDFDDYYNFDNSIISKFKIKAFANMKLAVVFDEIESITLNSEKKYVLNIFKTNMKEKKFPLIFISNTNHSKLLTDLKKYCPEVKYMCPSSYELNRFIQKICKGENIEIKDNASIDRLIEFAQHDVRRLINILQEYHYNYKTLNLQDIIKFIDKSIMKDTSIGLFEASSVLLNNINNFNDIFKLYEIDKVLMPLMIHENYYKKIITAKNKNPLNDQITDIVKISESL